MRRILYRDMEQEPCCVSYILGEGVELRQAGTTLYFSPAQDRDRPETFALVQALERSGVFLLFEDDPVERPPFYAVPRADLFARDARGGWYASIGGMTGPGEPFPICHIGADGCVRRAAASLGDLLDRVRAVPPRPLENAPFPSLTLYPSRAAAQARLAFFTPPDSL